MQWAPWMRILFFDKMLIKFMNSKQSFSILLKSFNDFSSSTLKSEQAKNKIEKKSQEPSES